LVLRFARLGVTLLGGAALALVVLTAASARPLARARYGGTLVVGATLGDTDSLDPTLSRSSTASEVYAATCEKLYTYDTRSRIVPQLATAPPVISKDN
jgi:ABC-type transport system substrate-binding protein